MSDFIPVPEVNCFDNVGQCIPLKLKQNIWGGQFIDLSLLLRSAKDIHDSLGRQGEKNPGWESLYCQIKFLVLSYNRKMDQCFHDFF